MERILGRRWLSHRAKIAAKLEGEASVKKVGTVLKALIDRLLPSSVWDSLSAFQEQAHNALLFLRSPASAGPPWFTPSSHEFE